MVTIHTPRFITAETRAPDTGIGGRFIVELIHAKTGLIKQRLEFGNLITDAGLNALLATSGAATLDTMLSYAGVGTNNTAPSVGDTALGAQVGGRVNADGGIADAFATVTSSPEYVSAQRTRQWGTTEGNGNLTEIGFFSASSGGVMWCRTLFKDSFGTPITITKTSSDILRVTYEVRLYPALGDTTQSALTISGTNYDFVWRPVTRTLWPFSLWWSGLVGIARDSGGVIGDRTTLLSRFGTDFGIGTELNSDSHTISWNLSTLTHARNHTFSPSLGSLTINSLEIGAIQNASGLRCPYQATVTPAMAKTGSNQLSLDITLQWARVTI